MNRSVYRVHAFTDGEAGGNPAGVVPYADGLGPAQKQAIAARLGLSETAFVSTSTQANCKLEFFTPTRQIAHCGHATIAAFSLLRQLGRLPAGPASKETIDGLRRIELDRELAYMEQKAPRYAELDAGQQAAALAGLGLDASALHTGLAPCIVDTGNGFLLLPLRNEAAVSGIQPRLDAIAALSERFDLIGFYAFSLEARQPGRQAGARMFAPRYGIAEEAATGMAAGPLACFLRERMGMEREVFAIEQGRLMPEPSPSVIEVRLDLDGAGCIRGLMAGGRARIVEQMEFSL
ncbi:MAG: PhzF family phenazine biosynthesis protein [Gammaproteobacteria bacterium]|nr:PhzF family phenazine biosynthesis protein [Gammaproteobacteria bacterium]